MTKKTIFQAVAAGLLLFTGCALLVYMISVEDEPGAIPLILIGLSTIWLLKIRLLHNNH